MRAVRHVCLPVVKGVCEAHLHCQDFHLQPGHAWQGTHICLQSVKSDGVWLLPCLRHRALHKAWPLRRTCLWGVCAEPGGLWEPARGPPGRQPPPVQAPQERLHAAPAGRRPGRAHADLQVLSSSWAGCRQPPKGLGGAGVWLHMPSHTIIKLISRANACCIGTCTCCHPQIQGMEGRRMYMYMSAHAFMCGKGRAETSQAPVQHVVF